MGLAPVRLQERSISKNLGSKYLEFLALITAFCTEGRMMNDLGQCRKIKSKRLQRHILTTASWFALEFYMGSKLRGITYQGKWGWGKVMVTTDLN